MTKEEKQILETEYPLIPTSEIEWEARCIAVAWVEGYEERGFDIEGKHKLASDIMNYSRRKIEKYNIGLADYIRGKDAESASLRAISERLVKVVEEWCPMTVDFKDTGKLDALAAYRSLVTKEEKK